MPAGRRPKPTNILRFTGNPGKRPLNRREPQPVKPRRAPPAPAILGEKGKVEWRRMCKILLQMGLLSEADLTVLMAYCKCFEQWTEAVRDTETFGSVHLTSNGNMIQSPHVGIANTALSNMTRLAIEFGLTPASRSRVQVPGGGKSSAGREYFFGERRAPTGGGA